MKIEFVKPEEIEKKSMETIMGELRERGIDCSRFTDEEMAVVRRCIHTSADFDYALNLRFSHDAVKTGIRCLMEGASVVTDTTMAASGINKRTLCGFGGSVHCFIGDEDVAKEAKSRGITRSSVAMERGSRLSGNVIFAVGNAPTALISLYELIQENRVKPALIIGAPVGFVNVVEAKNLIMETDIPYIVPAGRKGGSNIAAAIVNAMLYLGAGR